MVKRVTATAVQTLWSALRSALQGQKGATSRQPSWIWRFERQRCHASAEIQFLVSSCPSFESGRILNRLVQAEIGIRAVLAALRSFFERQDWTHHGMRYHATSPLEWRRKNDS